MIVIFLTCPGSILYTPEPEPLISPESTFSGKEKGGGGVRCNLNPVNSVFTKPDRKVGQNQSKTPGDFGVFSMLEHTLPCHKSHEPNWVVWCLNVHGL